MEATTKIIIADSQPLFRKSLIALVSECGDFEVIAEAESGRQLIDVIKVKTPDLIILDNEMPLIDCKAILQMITYRFPKTRLIVLSNQHREELLHDFVSNGANCYLSKSCSAETLFKAIRVVMRDGYFVDNITYKVVLDSMVRDKTDGNPFNVADFNDREMDILREVCEGKTNREIASDLKISPSTVDFYKNKIYTKSNCNSVMSLLKFALRRGYVGL